MADRGNGDEGPVVVVVDRVNAYVLEMLDAVREVFDPSGVPLLVHVNDYFTVGVPASLRGRFRRGGVRGVLAVPLSSTQAHDEVGTLLAEHPRLPTVSIAGGPGHRSTVSVDNRTGMTDLVRHLAAVPGVRRVALLRGVPHHPDSLEREAIVRSVLAEHGLSIDPALVVDSDFDRDLAYRAVAGLVAAGHELDAVVALNDASALGAMDAVMDAGLAVPGDVVVTGFDDDRSHARVGLTTVDQQLRVQGRLAAQLLLELIADGGPDQHHVVPSRLVTRESTDRRRATAATTSAPLPRTQQVDEMTLRDGVLAMNRAFMSCTTEREVMRELAANLPRLHVSRCFVVLNEPGEQRLGRLVLAHPQLPPTVHNLAPAFQVDDVLPPALAGELDHGTLLAQSLAVPGHKLGYVLYEQAPLHEHTTEVLRLDLSRALDGIFRQRQLEGVVAQRTQQLRSEITVRRRAEADLRAANVELRRSLHRDGLTGIANRAAFDAQLAQTWAEHAATGTELSLLFVDVDCFKAYNDTYGHLGGDDALRVVARSLERSCRGEHDLAARFGGEEFAVVLPGTGAATAAETAERVRQDVRRAQIAHRDSPVCPWLTVSIGTATVVPTAPFGPHDLLAAADRGVYLAKAAGRDRVAVGTPVLDVAVCASTGGP